MCQGAGRTVQPARLDLGENKPSPGIWHAHRCGPERRAEGRRRPQVHRQHMSVRQWLPADMWKRYALRLLWAVWTAQMLTGKAGEGLLRLGMPGC